MMYLKHFNLEKNPFSLTPNTDFYCELPNYKDALEVINLSLDNGEGFIKIVGEIGTGKTFLCRLLLKSVKENMITAYIPNPDLTADGLRIAVAKELGIEIESPVCQHSLIDKINQHLLNLHQQGKRVVLLVDEAQCLSEACLEAIRLLTNLETESEKLLQVVLFGQPELDVKLTQSSLRQLQQRITFSYYLKPLNESEMEAYICHRLAMAGYTYGMLFSRKARKLLFKASGGLPRLLNILCHKGLMVAYGKGERAVSHKAIKRAISDTESAFKIKNHYGFFIMSAISVVVIVWGYWQLGIFS